MPDHNSEPYSIFRNTSLSVGLAGLMIQAAVEGSDALSDAATEGESASATDAAVMQAQHAQREAMLVSQDSLNDSHKRLLEVREALQRDERGDNEHGEILQGEAISPSELLSDFNV